MFILTAKLTRKRAVLWVVVAGLLVGLLIMVLGISSRHTAAAPGGINVENISDNTARVSFLSAYGWQVAAEPVETLRLLLPESMDADWKAYNILQKEQGFDLEPYCGKRVERYTYNVENHPQAAGTVQVNLYLCDGTVVAGDVFCAGENGFQQSLIFPETTAADR